MTDTALEVASDQERRDEEIAAELMAGRSARAVQRQFGISLAELDAALERLFPIDLAARFRMIKTDLGALNQLARVFLEKALAGDVASGLCAVRVYERKHELLGMNAAARVEIVQAPVEEPSDFEKVRAAIMRVANDQPPAQRAAHNLVHKLGGERALELLKVGCNGDDYSADDPADDPDDSGLGFEPNKRGIVG